jgi:hypothetical protein
MHSPHASKGEVIPNTSPKILLRVFHPASAGGNEVEPASHCEFRFA